SLSIATFADFLVEWFLKASWFYQFQLLDRLYFQVRTFCFLEKNLRNLQKTHKTED
ncbi:40945_t:CDS:1, partial [Gigaspora margarita]